MMDLYALLSGTMLQNSAFTSPSYGRATKKQGKEKTYGLVPVIACFRLILCFYPSTLKQF